MGRKIAVEDGLSPVREYLIDKGYDVVGLEEGEPVSIMVISGMDQDFMGIENISNDVPVISARGKTAQAVWREIEDRLIH